MNLILVLGYTLNDDGSVSPVLEGRLKKVKEIMDNCDDSRIILTGAKEESKEISQAASMQAWIQEIVPYSHITVTLEEQAINTIEQLLHLYIHLQTNKYDEVHIIGSEGGFGERIRTIWEFMDTNIPIVVEEAKLPENLSKEDKEVLRDNEEKKLSVINGLIAERGAEVEDPIRTLAAIASEYRKSKEVSIEPSYLNNEVNKA